MEDVYKNDYQIFILTPLLQGHNSSMAGSIFPQAYYSFNICTLYDHKTNDYIRGELRITGIIHKIDEYRRNWLSHLQIMPQNRIPFKPDHKEGEQLEDRRRVGASSCNSGDVTDQRVQPLMCMMMMIIL